MLNRPPLIINRQFHDTLELLENTDTNVYITGRAGTGKSTLLSLFRRTTKKKTIVLAPTGVAALNVKGQTIHSFFRFPAKPMSPGDIKRVRSRKIYEKMEVCIIDEISMVRADLLDNIDRFLRINRGNRAEPFGGVQMIFFGDLFQLPPVVSSEAEIHLMQSFYDSPYFFSAQVFESGFHMEMIELRQVYRQEGLHFLRLLDAVRLNRVDYEDLEDLNERHLPAFEAEDFYITLSPRNRLVNQINDKELRNLDTPELSFVADVTGKFDPRLYPAELELKLKEGAQVMFVRNDTKRKFVNGTIGKIKTLRPNIIEVVVQSKDKIEVIEVEKSEWEIEKYKLDDEDTQKIKTEVVGTFKQYPLRLAWAITIHKSQGKTFDKVIIDMGRGAFEHGQTYVALSRCRSLEGIVLKQKLNFRDVMTDERIVEWHETWR